MPRWLPCPVLDRCTARRPPIAAKLLQGGSVGMFLNLCAAGDSVSVHRSSSPPRRSPDQRGHGPRPGIFPAAGRQHGHLEQRPAGGRHHLLAAIHLAAGGEPELHGDRSGPATTRAGEAGNTGHGVRSEAQASRRGGPRSGDPDRPVPQLDGDTSHISGVGLRPRRRGPSGAGPHAPRQPRRSEQRAEVDRLQDCAGRVGVATNRCGRGPSARTVRPNSLVPSHVPPLRAAGITSPLVIQIGTVTTRESSVTA